MDFFERLVMKYTTFFQNYRISCLVQLLRIRFLSFIKCCISLFKLYNLVLYTPFTPFLFTPPPFPPCLHPHAPLRFPPFLHSPRPPFTPPPTHLPASLAQPPFAFAPFMGVYLLVDFKGGAPSSLPPPPPRFPSLPPPPTQIGAKWGGGG